MRVPVIALALALSLACGGLGPTSERPVPEPEPEEATPVPAACPPGVGVREGWEGEYPLPVIDVTAHVDLPARTHPCALEPDRTCALAPGLYHPWAPGTAATYATVRAVERFRTRVAVEVPDGDGSRTLPAGTEIEMHLYLGEGVCSLVALGAPYSDACPDRERDRFEPITTADPPPAPRQLLGVPCGSGTGWVEVDGDLPARPEIREGTILGFGEVGPGEDP